MLTVVLSFCARSARCRRDGTGTCRTVTAPLTRRALLTGLVVAGLGACSGAGGTSPSGGSRYLLTARPDPAARAALDPGTSQLRLQNGLEGLLHVPGRRARGLVVALHGAGGNAAGGLRLVRDQADRLGLVVLAPASAGSTWAAIRGGDDPDTSAVDAALRDVLARQPVEPARLAVAGFSDGASYALTLGLANGELFPHVLAFSPGFQRADRRRGRPEVFVSHGTRDEVLPIERTSRPLVRALQRDGYGVTYREFDGRHVVPRGLADEALQRVLR